MPKKGGKKNNRNPNGVQKRALIYKENMQEYVQTSKMLGDRRILVTLPDKTEMLAMIPGSFRKRCWIKVGDILLVSRREFQSTKLDVCYKYDEDEAKKLVKELEIPDFFLQSINNNSCTNDEDLVWFEEKGDNSSPENKTKNLSRNYGDYSDLSSEEEEESVEEDYEYI